METTISENIIAIKCSQWFQNGFDFSIIPHYTVKCPKEAKRAGCVLEDEYKSGYGIQPCYKDFVDTIDSLLEASLRKSEFNMRLKPDYLDGYGKISYDRAITALKNELGKIHMRFRYLDNSLYYLNYFLKYQKRFAREFQSCIDKWISDHTVCIEEKLKRRAEYIQSTEGIRLYNNRLKQAVIEKAIILQLDHPDKEIIISANYKREDGSCELVKETFKSKAVSENDIYVIECEVSLNEKKFNKILDEYLHLC